MKKKGVWGILIAYLFILICPSAVTATQTMNAEAVSTESSVMLPGTSGQFEVGEGTTDRNQLGYGNVIIFNYSDFTKETLSGTILELSGEKNETWTTLAGKAHVLTNLPEGTYTLTTKSVPDGYIASDAIAFTVDENGVVKATGKDLNAISSSGNEFCKIEVFQKAQTCQIDFILVDSNNDSMGGADLSILLPSGKELRNWQTAAGKLRRVDLAPGEYILHENSAPDGLKIAEDITFTVDGTGKLFVDGVQVDRIQMVNEGTVRDNNPDESAVAMYRLYHPHTKEHFYTSSKYEKDILMGRGWKYEGVAWYAPTISFTPVYRLYNPTLKDHHYTTDEHERDVLSSKYGWIYEGIGWYSDDNKTVPLYRRYCPFLKSGSHHYTSGCEEASHLLTVGWKDEGIAWYGLNPDKK
uniref:SpaA isopeptide-forming pilin-related protein n=1 Tax=Eubacterium cellulosolvens TaxID=29322 RepID=UPI000AAA48FB|nr:SpaA isopeptide-forming pilin-related protein [[Eubacterium] cellulosolvens]